MKNEAPLTAEGIRLSEDRTRLKNWKRWGPYLFERQWATVREDYSSYGNCWDYFPHDHARSRVYRWPGEGNNYLFGGNSKWRGPIWFPINYLLVEALECYHHFYGDTLKVECPVRSGRFLTLSDVAIELSRRLGSLFLPNSEGARPCHGADLRYVQDPNWRELVLFHEF